MTNEISYSVGALLYCPAYNDSLVHEIAETKIQPPYSVALCLEDSIADDAVEEAEHQLITTMQKLSVLQGCYMPKIFIRVRNVLQARHMYHALSESRKLLTGFIFPKFTISNIEEYQETIVELNKNSEQTLYMMPILETRDILNIMTRKKVLSRLREKLDSVREYVLNVRIGGNDFCNYYGLRRSVRQSIYDIGLIQPVLSDIANIFVDDYVVSAPVWEYFDNGTNDHWKRGLQQELSLDRLNGFIGKTAIHPSQIAVINESLKPSLSDYRDAENILHWESSVSGVQKSADGTRMKSSVMQNGLKKC